ncbi:flagellar export protein FliJ [Clostridiaceae bacterium HSG29]|nr:flagellar export protein FliJ [Clostridiaceae bacterium HSG29]
MKKFVFTYEKILRLKVELENEAKNELAVAIQKKVKLKTKLEKFVDDQNKYLVHLNELISKGVKASELKRFNSEKSYFTKGISEIKRSIEKQEIAIIERRHELTEALKETKKFEKLKEKEYEKYVEEIFVSERKTIEEIVNYNNYKLSGDKNGR